MTFGLVELGVLIVAISHLLFLILEMFLWDKPIGLKIFRQDEKKAAITKVLAANQGLYNGFLAAGLIWSLVLDKPFAVQAQLFFLCCVVIAGIYGAISVNRRIFYIQALPAICTILLIFFA